MKTIIEVIVGAGIVLGALYWVYKKYAEQKVDAAVTEVKTVVAGIEKNV